MDSKQLDFVVNLVKIKSGLYETYAVESFFARKIFVVGLTCKLVWLNLFRIFAS